MIRLKTRTLIGIMAAVMVLCAAAAVLIRYYTTDNCIARIYHEDTLLYEIDLSEVEEPYTIELAGNSVLVEPGLISMQSATCPDKLCVKMGKIKSGAYPIVCLPNKVRIVIVTGDSDGIDAVSG